MKRYVGQRGLSSLGMLFVLLVIMFVATCAIKLLPHYMDNWSFASAIETSVENNEYDDMSVGQIRQKLGKYMTMNRVDGIKSRDLRIQKRDGMVLIDASYEKRVEFLFNIDVVMKFDNLKFEFPAK